MPHKRLGDAVASYLELFAEIAKAYGNPFSIQSLPNPVEVAGRRVMHSSLYRYLTWIEKFYREKGRSPPVAVSGTGRGEKVYVDLRRVEREASWARSAGDPWPYVAKSKSELAREVEEPKAKVRELESKLQKLGEAEKCGAYTEILRKLATATPADVVKCVEFKLDTPECWLTRLVLDRATTYVGDTTAVDILLERLTDSYADEIEALARKLSQLTT